MRRLLWALIVWLVAAGLAHAQSPAPRPVASASAVSASPAVSPATAPAASGSPVSAAPTAAPSAAPAPQPSTSPGAVVVPIPLPMVVDRSTASMAVVERIEQDLNQVSEVDSLEEHMRDLKAELVRFGSRVDKTLSEDNSLDAVQALVSDLQAVWEPVEGWSKLLLDRTAVLEANKKTLQGQRALWTLTAKAASEQDVPAELADSIRGLCAHIDATLDKTDQKLRDILGLQSQLGETRGMYRDIGDRLAAASERAATMLFRADSAPLWTAVPYRTVGGVAEAERAMSARLGSVTRYVAGRGRAPLVHACLVLLLSLLTLLAGRAFKRWDELDATTTSGLATSTPIATAWVMSLPFLVFVYPSPPRVFTLLLVITTMVAATMVLRKHVQARLQVGLAALIATAGFDVLRGLTSTDVSVFRLILVAEQLAGIGFIIWMRLSGRLLEARARSPRAVRYVQIAGVFALAGFTTSFVANVCGYANLARYILNLTVGPIYAALIIVATVRVLDTYLLFFLRAWPLSLLMAVTGNRERLRRVLRNTFLVLGVMLWIRYFVSQMPLAGIIAAKARDILNADIGLGGTTPAGILMFLLAVAASFLVSRVILVLLEEDVYPRVPLPSGLPYAISTILHYLLVLLGFLIALSVLGLDMTRFTVMVSAFGVGLGFGLQTIVNNVVSGIILLFERPVKIGDVIEMNNNRGRLTHIGLRASVLHASDGSDIILPNGTLLSSNVVNYSFADENRRIDIEVQIPSGHDAEAVMQRLVEQTRQVDGVLASPAPECLFVKFTEKALVLEVHVWVRGSDGWRQTKSALNLAIYGTLLKDGLVASLPPAEG